MKNLFKRIFEFLKRRREVTLKVLDGFDLAIGISHRVVRLITMGLFLSFVLGFILLYTLPLLVFPGQLAGVLALGAQRACPLNQPCNFDLAYGTFSASILLLVELFTSSAILLRYGWAIFNSTQPEGEPESLHESIERMSFELVEIRARLGEG